MLIINSNQKLKTYLLILNICALLIILNWIFNPVYISSKNHLKNI